MSWEADIINFYERLKPKPIFSTKTEVDTIFSDVVIPAFESISLQLKPHVKDIKIKRHVYKASISFVDEICKRSTFGVDINIKYDTISFPSHLSSFSSFPSGIKIKQLEDINKELIISNFMTFFISREKQIEEYTETYSNADYD